MLINKPKKGETVYWMSINNDTFTDNTLVMSNEPMPRIHSGKVVSYDSRNRVVQLQVVVSEKYIDNPMYFTQGVKKLANGKYPRSRAQIGMPTNGLYGSMTDVKLAIIKFITNDFDTDELQ